MSFTLEGSMAWCDYLWIAVLVVLAVAIARSHRANRREEERWRNKVKCYGDEGGTKL